MNIGNFFGLSGIAISGIEIEIFASNVYYTVFGELKEIKKFKNTANKYFEQNKISRKFIVSKINYPLAQVHEIISKKDKDNKYVLGEYVEPIQCTIYANCPPKTAKNMYCVLCIEEIEDGKKRKLSFPSINLEKSKKSPNSVILKEIKKMVPEYASIAKKSIKLLDIAGDNEDILVYTIHLDATEDKSKNINSESS